MAAVMQAIGLKALIADLTGASYKALGRATLAIHETAEDIEDTMRTLVPVGEGDTRDSIGIDKYPLGADIGPTTYWARFLEDGTSKMPPHSFAGPALDRHSAELELKLLKAVEI